MTENKIAGFSRYWLQFIGPALFVYVFIKFVDVNRFSQILKGISAKYFIVSIMFNLLGHLGKLLRTYYLLKKNEIKIKPFQMARIYSYSAFVGLISNSVFSDITGAGMLIMRDKERKLRISNIFIFNRIFEMIIISLIFVTTLSIHFGLLESFMQIRHQKIVLITSLLFLITLIAFYLHILLALG